MSHDDVVLIVNAINALSGSVSGIGTILLLMAIFKNMSGSDANPAIENLKNEIARLRQTIIDLKLEIKVK